MMSTEHPLLSSLVRIRDANNRIVGAGVLVAGNLVCTCAHVAAIALNIPYAAKEQPSGTIGVEFPAFGQEVVPAQVKVWPPNHVDDNGDFAILHLLSTLPPSARPARLLAGSTLPGRPFEVCGFPEGNEAGGWTRGVLGHKRSDGTIQIEGTHVTGYRVQAGFSGAPVWDTKERGVVGIVVAAERDAATKVAFILPIEVIRRTCADIKAIDTRQPFAFVTEGLAGLPGSPLSGVEQFLGEYLGTPDKPVPFGGRREQLAELDRWLDDASHPYALMVAEAGRGKSALLTQWIAAVAEQGRAGVAFVPVSIRFGTALKSTAFSILGARLRRMNRVTADPPQDPEVWLAEVEQYLREDRPEGEPPLLVIIEGADEAVNWVLGSDLRVPPQPGRGVKILVSARTQVGRDAAVWLRDLGWEGMATRIALPPLDQAGVAEVLQSLGNPLAGLATKVDVVSQLHRLSDGDPLLVRLYVAALQHTGEHAAFLKPEELADLKPGLSAYFDRWWADQQQQWDEEAPLKEPAVRAMLNLLACALGALAVDDLLSLAAPEGLDSWTLREALRPLGRFVIAMGDGQQQGYVFSHSRLNHYFYEEQLAPRDRRLWEQRFLDFGQRVLQLLSDGRLDPREASPYAVKYYAEHLDRAKAEPEYFYALVQEGWLRAWAALEGTYDGFLGNLRYAWQRAERVGREATHPARGLAIGQQLRCALIVASINTLARNIDGGLLAALVEKKLWTPSQALAYVLRNPDERDLTSALKSVVSYLPELLVRQAIAAVQSFHYKFLQPQAMAALLPRFIALGHAEEALALIPTIEMTAETAQVIAKLLPQLSETQRATVITEALVAANTIEEHSSRAGVLVALAPYVPEAEKLALFRDIIPAVGTMGRGTLEKLASCLPEALLREALAAARHTDYPWAGVTDLVILAQRLPEPERLSVVSEALAAVPSIEGDAGRMLALSRMGRYLPERLLREAIGIAQRIEEEWRRSYALAGLTPLLARLGFPQEAFTVAQAMTEADYRAQALLDILPCLTDAERPKAFEEALAAARVTKAYARVEHLVKLAVHQPEPERSLLFKEALAALQESRSGRLGNIAALLPDAVLREALALVHIIEDEFTRTDALVDLALYLPEAARPAVFAEILAIADRKKGARQDNEALSLLASRLEAFGASPAALAAARAIEDAVNRARALRRLARYQPEDERRGVLVEAVAAARKISDTLDRVESLIRLLYVFPEVEQPNLLAEAVAAIRGIDDGAKQAELLAQLARVRPVEGFPLLAEAVAAIRGIDDGAKQAELLAQLARVRPEAERLPLLTEAVAALRSTSLAAGGHAYYMRALLELAPQLPEALLRETVSIIGEDVALSARYSAHEPDRWRWLHGIQWVITPLTERLVRLGVPQEAVALVRRFPLEHDEFTWQMHLSAELAPQLSEHGYVHDALEVARAIRNPYWRTEALARVIPRLPETARPAALAEAGEAARAVEVRLRDRLGGTSTDAWTTTAADDAAARVRAWARLAEVLPETEQLGALNEALAAARDLEWCKDVALAGLSLQMARRNLTQRAREIMQEIPIGVPRAQALWGLVKYGPTEERAEVMAQALAVARAMGGINERSDALPTTSARSSVGTYDIWHTEILPLEDLYPLWCEQLRILASCTRYHLLHRLAEQVPFIRALGGTQAIAETVQAIIDVGRWFP